ncbi:MAG TPA: hypothetical protein VGD54_13675 [Steroidobacteraceae bacterium]
MYNRVALTLSGLALCLGIGVAAADVVTVVSSKSAVIALSKRQVADIFLGKSNHFPDGAQAVPIDQPEASNIREEFYKEVAGKSPAQLKAHWSKIIFTGRGQPPKIVLNSSAVKKLLSENLSAISYIEASEVDSTVKVLRAP